MTDQTQRPKSGGSYKRDKGGKLKAVHQPDTAAGKGPRNAQGKRINSRHQVLDPDTGRPVEKTPAAAPTKSDKKGGE